MKKAYKENPSQIHPYWREYFAKNPMDIEVSVDNEKVEDIRLREINEKLTKIINDYRSFGHYFSKIRSINTY